MVITDRCHEIPLYSIEFIELTKIKTGIASHHERVYKIFET